MEVVNAIGRRKAAVARVFVSEGTGKITINKRELEKYFPSSILQFIVKQPLAKLNVAEQYDIKINLAVERKKPGRPKARKRFQFSKR